MRINNIRALTIGMAAISLMSIVPGFAAESQSTASKPTTPASPLSSTGAPNDGSLQELSLNDIQDVGIILRLIGDGAKNIYEEAARTAISPLDPPQIHTIKNIPYSIKGTVLPARQQWLVYYLGSMEPVIRELGKDVQDIQTGSKQMVIPEPMQKQLDPLWDEWASSTNDMNKQLDQLVALFDDAPHNNEKLRDIAVNIYKDVEKLEVTRQAVYRVMAQGSKGGKKIMVSPF